MWLTTGNHGKGE